MYGGFGHLIKSKSRKDYILMWHITFNRHRKK